MKKVEDRRKAIKDLLSASESINVETLAEMLGVTGATIRKDIRDMESTHELFRSKGYVSLNRPRIIDLDINEKFS